MPEIPTRESLLTELREAFAGVVLGNGVGLREADALDSYADKATLRQCRQQDERLDWTAIPVAELEYNYASPCHFDSEGMRFQLPAFLSAYLTAASNEDFTFFLTRGSHHIFSLLNARQRSVVRKYLLYLEAEQAAGGIDFALPSISESLRTSWSE